ncbi:hypothetical protein [Methylobacterium tardum]|uniref:Uncharacterized protein n=1 Tax=Methylobacterium tardum TaxID=374432 RepID=A0AA37THF8_9HYPH|nr:hypothetical protein [Methylobacterium tardum]URD35948.1 hypothetical protein M6G65_26475 [Methylobacterium tardum]GLS72172.1 hypothetical protein GCM10007890_41850 [Methylobacterium tardum]
MEDGSSFAWVVLLLEAVRSADRLESIDDRAFVNAVASVPLSVPADSSLLIVSDICVLGLFWEDHRGAESCDVVVDETVLMKALVARICRNRPAAGPCANYPRAS